MASSQTKKILMIVGAVAVLLLLVCAGGAYGIYAVIRASTEASEKVIADFHANYNAKDYAAMHKDFHPALQKIVSIEKLTHMATFIHRENGRFVSSSGSGWNVNSNNGVTEIRLNYSVQYERDSGSAQFRLIETGGRPQIVEFNINTPKLNAYDENASYDEPAP